MRRLQKDLRQAKFVSQEPQFPLCNSNDIPQSAPNINGYISTLDGQRSIGRLPWPDSRHNYIETKRGKPSILFCK